MFIQTFRFQVETLSTPTTVINSHPGSYPVENGGSEYVCLPLQDFVVIHNYSHFEFQVVLTYVLIRIVVVSDDALQ